MNYGKYSKAKKKNFPIKVSKTNRRATVMRVIHLRLEHHFQGSRHPHMFCTSKKTLRNLSVGKHLFSSINIDLQPILAYALSLTKCFCLCYVGKMCVVAFNHLRYNRWEFLLQISPIISQNTLLNNDINFSLGSMRL